MNGRPIRYRVDWGALYMTRGAQTLLAVLLLLLLGTVIVLVSPRPRASVTAASQRLRVERSRLELPTADGRRPLCGPLVWRDDAYWAICHDTYSELLVAVRADGTAAVIEFNPPPLGATPAPSPTRGYP